MRRLAKALMVLLVAIAVCLAMLLLITYRLTPEASFPAIWSQLAGQKAPEALLAQRIAGSAQPPPYLRRLAVTWHRAQPLTWWWLPLVFIAIRFLINRWVASRRPRLR